MQLRIFEWDLTHSDNLKGHKESNKLYFLPFLKDFVALGGKQEIQKSYPFIKWVGGGHEALTMYLKMSGCLDSRISMVDFRSVLHSQISLRSLHIFSVKILYQL